MKNELLKQWQQDIEYYGDNAYLMWTIDNVVFSSNEGVKIILKPENYTTLKKFIRKQSVELPFDLERLKLVMKLNLI